jgi:hypothetical protein
MNNHGGARKGAGRHKALDTKEPVTLYVKRSVLSTFTQDNDVKEQRSKCRAFFSESLAQRAKSLNR